MPIGIFIGYLNFLKTMGWGIEFGGKEGVDLLRAKRNHRTILFLFLKKILAILKGK